MTTAAESTRDTVRRLFAELREVLMDIPAADITPRGDRVLCVMLEAPDERTTESGIILMSGKGGAKVEPICRALVLKVGDHDAVVDIKPGDTVLCGQHVGQDVPHSDMMLRLIREQDLLGVITE